MIESSPVTILPGVGEKVATLFRRLGISTIADLLRHYPIGYDDYTQELKTEFLSAGEIGWMEGVITESKTRRSFGRRGLHITEAILDVSGNTVSLIWFNRFPIKNLPLDKKIRVAGKVESNLQIRNPMWEVANERSRFKGKLLARYPLTTGLSQTLIRQAVDYALGIKITEWLPIEIIKQNNFLTLSEALQKIHQPSSLNVVESARQRLAFDEIFVLQVAEQIHLENRLKIKSNKITIDPVFYKQTIQALPFDLTDEQNNAVDEILRDLEKGHPMNRLLQGEVGSGKTIVAAISAAQVLKARYQALYLAPTEILANQQYESIANFYQDYGFRVALLTRSSAIIDHQLKAKKDILVATEKGEVDMLIGTHAILNEKINLSNLALVIVDEQHRFGVEQRLKALSKGDAQPHLLSMTATPIPRTLQQAYYADLDVSTLKDVPTGKRQVTTYLAKPDQREFIEKRLREHLRQGEQAYVVCPLIDPSDKILARAAVAEYDRLKSGPLSDYKVGYIDGKLKAEEKQQVLNDFKSKKINVLVSTSVVEVGIDVPNATTIIIEGAERFGLAQLHQLRGRVGRAGQPGYCLLFTENPSAQSWERLEKFSQTQDGFALAELDLELRGPGEWFGVKQSGYPDFKIANLADLEILKKAKQAASDLLQKDFKLKKYPVLNQRVERLVKVARQA